MKRNIFILILLICFVSCSKGQSNDYSKEILGCWELYDAHYEIKSNNPIFDSIALEIKMEFVKKAKAELFISKFFSNNVTRDYLTNGNHQGYGDYFVIKGDSLFVQNTIRKDSKSASKIKIYSDTLFLETNTPKEIEKILDDLKWDDEVSIPDDIMIEKAKRYTIFIRVKDCDKYQ